MKLDLFGLGSFRFFLAFLVAISHLWAGMPHGFAAYAVWGFFVLSGFLMTYVIREKYGFDSRGLKIYAFNRFMRIYPLYFLAVILGVATLYYYQRFDFRLTGLNGEFYLPQSLREWMHVVTLFPAVQRGGLPVPVSNALSIEVGYYFLLPLLATSKGAALFGLIMGCILNLKLGINGSSFSERYATFIPCLLAFSMGACLFHFRDKLRALAFPKISFTFWMLNGIVWFLVPSWPWDWGLYVSAILSAWVVISTYEARIGAVDKFLGDMSYPIYLLHTTVGAWFICWCGIERSFAFFALSFAATIAICVAIVYAIDRPLSKLKIQVK